MDVVVGDVGGEHAADALMFVKPRHIRAVEDLLGAADGDHLLDGAAGAGDGGQFDKDVRIVLREFAGGRPVAIEAMRAHERDMRVVGHDVAEDGGAVVGGAVPRVDKNRQMKGFSEFEGGFVGGIGDRLLVVVRQEFEADAVGDPFADFRKILFDLVRIVLMEQ